MGKSPQGQLILSVHAEVLLLVQLTTSLGLDVLDLYGEVVPDPEGPLVLPLRDLKLGQKN